ncbi:hypothetical protein FSB64_35790 [Paraburkholderia sp. JPY454]|uniref:protein-glutamate methylesterase n=2 Tax=Paraburkholderia youngii TaxID=2782701 RepID=A0ABX2NWW2_9BURK|nr:hypothetical protein [Paraburkholderia youngii]
MDARDIVVIAGSRGAFSVLKTLADGLPPELPAAVCVVLHIGLHETRLPVLLSAWGALPASHPADGEPLARGRIYVAPPGRHMLVSDGKLCVNNGAAENFARPAADPLFSGRAISDGFCALGQRLAPQRDLWLELAFPLSRGVRSGQSACTLDFFLSSGYRSVRNAAVTNTHGR